MNRLLLLFLAGWLCQCQSPPTTAPEVDPEEARLIRKFFDEALAQGEAYENLRHLCLEIGPRLSGSDAAAEAVEWVAERARAYRPDGVFLQDIMVPHWERGKAEKVQVLSDGTYLAALAIGGSVPTPEAGLEATVVEVQSLEEVEELGEEVIGGKIVFYNRAFDPRNISTGASYGGAVDQRTKGASQAAKYGAVGVLVRSVTSAQDDVPHTGTLVYADSLPRIPAACLGVQSADRLSAALAQHQAVQVRMELFCRWLPEAPSHNVVVELRGSERPDQVILFGGHLDSWDVGQGAHDDGAGCMHALEVIRLFKALGIQPRHTLRAVMFMNEENGSMGGKTYAKLVVENQEDHLIAIESDAGGFSPRGYGLTGEASTLEKFRSWLPLFPQNTISYVNQGGGGVDIRPLHQETGTPMMGLVLDSQRAFDYHHSAHDTFDKVHPRELHLGAASLAAMVYLIDRHGL